MRQTLPEERDPGIKSCHTRSTCRFPKGKEIHLLLCQRRYRGALVEVALAGDAVEEVGI